MTTRIKHVDPSANTFGASVTWSSGTAEFANTDVLDIGTSLRGAASHTTIDVAAGASCTVKINSLNKRHPLMDDARVLSLPIRNLADEQVWLDPNALTYTLAAGETLEITDIAVTSLEFTALTGTVVVTAY